MTRGKWQVPKSKADQHQHTPYILPRISWFSRRVIVSSIPIIVSSIKSCCVGKSANYKQASQGNPVAQNITASHGSHTTHSIRYDQEDTRRLLSIPSTQYRGGDGAYVGVLCCILSQSQSQRVTSSEETHSTRVVKNIERITAIRDLKQ